MVRGTIKRISLFNIREDPRSTVGPPAAVSWLSEVVSRKYQDTACLKLSSLQLIFLNRHTIWRGTVVVRLATGCTVGGSNPGGGKNFRTHPDRLG